LTKDSHPVVGPLLHRDPANPKQVADAKAPATFIAVTSDGLAVILRVGVETQSTQRKPGDFHFGAPEMNPVGDKKGRRFAVMYVDELEQ
jgi:hypothetical protein